MTYDMTYKDACDVLDIVASNLTNNLKTCNNEQEAEWIKKSLAMIDVAQDAIKFNIMVEDWIDTEDMAIIAEAVQKYGIDFVREAVEEKERKHIREVKLP